MNSFLNKDGLIHFSNKIKEYINNKINKLETDVSTLVSKVDTDKTEVEDKITIVKNDIINNTENITIVDNKVIDLKTKVDDINLTLDDHTDADLIKISNVQQYEFKNIAAGEVIAIDNNGSDIILECFSESTSNSSIDYKVLNLNSSNSNVFTCDTRFIDVAADGLKPKDNIVLNYTKTTEVVNGLTFDIYTSDVIPYELACVIETITSIGED